MLILSRKVGQQIVIGEGVVVTVLRVAGGKTTIGVEAPGDVKILRRELEDREPPPALAKAS